MSGHLLECPYTPGIWYSLDEPCICPQLRACEQRVREELFPLRSRLAEQLETARVNGWHAGWNAALEDGYAAGLNAARKAASTQRSKFKARDWDDAIEAALAAIDALREEHK